MMVLVWLVVIAVLVGMLGWLIKDDLRFKKERKATQRINEEARARREQY